jgi:hypothetical protein
VIQPIAHAGRMNIYSDAWFKCGIQNTQRSEFEVRLSKAAYKNVGGRDVSEQLERHR